jgi:hypothetical protein
VIDRVFLAANIPRIGRLASQCWLMALWELADAVLLTSAYAIVEADRNVQQAEQFATMLRSELFTRGRTREQRTTPTRRNETTWTIREHAGATGC